LLPAP